MVKPYPLFIPSGRVLQIMPVEKLPKHGIITDNITFFRVLTFYGLFPLHRNRDGDFELKWKSWQIVYSILFVTLGVIISAYGLKVIVGNIATRSLSFQEAAFFASFLCFPVMHVIPILVLIRAKMIADYANEWTKFIKRFERVTGKSAPSLSAHAWLVGGSIIFATTALFFYQLKNSIDDVFQVQGLDRKILYALFYLEVWGTGNIYSNICLLAIVAKGCESMSTALLKDVLEQTLEQKPLDEHMKLWLSLRQLCLNFGDVFWMIYSYIIFCMFAIALPVIYITADSLRYGHAGAFFMACVSVYCIYFLAAIAHRAVNAIGTQFGKSLAAAMLETTANGQLAQFIKDVASCPVSINLCGFLTLDHSLIVSISSTLITYLIIIMQFREQG